MFHHCIFYFLLYLQLWSLSPSQVTAPISHFCPLVSFPGTAHCPHPTSPTAVLFSSLLHSSPYLGSWPNLAESLSHDAMCVMLRWDPPHTLRKCSGPFSHPSVPLWRVGHYNWIQLPSQSIPDWFQPLPGYGFPQTMKICPNFTSARALGIKLWTTNMFMAEQRTLSSTIGNYHAHSSPSPSFNLRFVCRWIWLCAD